MTNGDVIILRDQISYIQGHSLLRPVSYNEHRTKAQICIDPTKLTTDNLIVVCFQSNGYRKEILVNYYHLIVWHEILLLITN